MANLQEKLNRYNVLIENHLHEIVPVSLTPYQALFEAARYSLLGGGKRLRPLLTLITAEMFGESPSIALPAACSLELIHTYSMIHDDLPCMDNDDYRRGKLTLHKVYPEGHAVLTGDFLLTYAFEILADAPQLSDEIKVKLIRILAQRSGAHGMIGGQVMDLDSENRLIPLDQLKQLHAHKSGALISAAVEFGGIIANVTTEQMNHLKTFGENIGLAFQIVDDVLDVTSSHIKHGRTIASDAINQKSTYVSLMGIEKAQATAEKHYQLSIDALHALRINTQLLEELAQFMIQRKH